jgi:hypothetical protein
MRQPPVQWTTPAPLWAGLASANIRPVREAMQQPAILRFANDTFMEEYINLLNVNPPGLADLWAQPETWRKPMTTPAPAPVVPTHALPMHQQRFMAAKNGARPRVARIAPSKTPVTEALRPAPPAPQTLKLYQPGHGRFYLLSACLVCRLPGLPDRGLNTATQEKVYFVVRRLKPPANNPNAICNEQNCPEYAFVTTAAGSRWVRVPDAERRIVRPGEEQNPLFPIAYNSTGQMRRLFSGLIPVARREAYLGAGMEVPAGEPGSEAAPDARRLLLRMTALEPWQRLIDQANDTKTRLNDAALLADDLVKFQTERVSVEAELRDRLLVASWYALVDLNLFFEEHLPNIWAHIQDANSPVTLSNAEESVLTLLDGIVYHDVAHPSLNMTLLQALRRIITFHQALENISEQFSRNAYNLGGTAWPNFTFLFADTNAGASYLSYPSDAPTVNDVEERIAAALPPQPTAPVPDVPLGAKPLPDAGDPGWFVVRCVFESPECGPLNPAAVSEATEVFQMANFFDPDAPARPIRISLPIDTTPAGLRKFAKNTAFVVSDVLACQMEKAGKLTLGDLVLSVLPFPFHKGLPDDMNEPCPKPSGLDLGKLCTLSIPIITICAFILLMIIVALFDIIFKWLPYLIICFPLPGLKAKKEGT